jgi:DNA-binding transcriptional LysR family regulator
VRFAVVGSHGYFAQTKNRRPKAPDDLLAHECIRARFSSGGVYKWEFAKRGERIEIDVKGALILDNHHLMRDAALNGVGLAWLSEWAVADDLATGRLVRVLEDWSPPSPGLCLYYPGHRHVPAGLRAFIDVIREFNPSSQRA